MFVDAWGKTDIGRKRAHNEDALCVVPELGLYMVCDGMGGHAAGEVASAKAVEVVEREIAKNGVVLEDFKRKDTPATREKLQALVERSVQRACHEIHSLANSDAGKAGMGTTLSMLLVTGDKGVMGHVGDSRLYLHRDGRLHQLSEDHSYLAEMLKSGKMSKDEAKRSQFGNVITRAVGIQQSVQVDTLLFDLLPGDTCLLCSDGLHGYTPDNEELGTILGRKDGQAIPDALVALANERGGKDNITALVIRARSATDAAQEADTARVQDVQLKLATLKKIPLFRHLTYQELVKVLNIVSIEVFEARCPIVKEGTEGEELYIILAGRVMVSKGGQDIVELHPGVHFGEMALIDQSPRSATVTAQETSRLMVIGRKPFYELIRREPVLAVKLLWSFVQVLSHRLRATNEQLQGARSELEAVQAIPFLEGEDVELE